MTSMMKRTKTKDSEGGSATVEHNMANEYYHDYDSTASLVNTYGFCPAIYSYGSIAFGPVPEYDGLFGLHSIGVDTESEHLESYSESDQSEDDTSSLIEESSNENVCLEKLVFNSDRVTPETIDEIYRSSSERGLVIPLPTDLECIAVENNPPVLCMVFPPPPPPSCEKEVLPYYSQVETTDYDENGKEEEENMTNIVPPPPARQKSTVIAEEEEELSGFVEEQEEEEEIIKKKPKKKKKGGNDSPTKTFFQPKVRFTECDDINMPVSQRIRVTEKKLPSPMIYSTRPFAVQRIKGIPIPYLRTDIGRKPILFIPEYLLLDNVRIFAFFEVYRKMGSFPKYEGGLVPIGYIPYNFEIFKILKQQQKQQIKDGKYGKGIYLNFSMDFLNQNMKLMMDKVILKNAKKTKLCLKVTVFIELSSRIYEIPFFIQTLDSWTKKYPILESEIKLVVNSIEKEIIESEEEACKKLNYLPPLQGFQYGKEIQIFDHRDEDEDDDEEDSITINKNHISTSIFDDRILFPGHKYEHIVHVVNKEKYTPLNKKKKKKKKKRKRKRKRDHEEEELFFCDPSSRKKKKRKLF